MRLLMLATALALSVNAAPASDWPMFGGNPARSGYTAEPLPPRLALCWAAHGEQAPVPAWPVSSRLAFDRAFHAVMADGRLFYGSSADHQVHARDAATGKKLWSFFTDGPVRFAPVVWKDRVLAASDDGYLYCLAAADGRLHWKQRGGSDDRLLLGNDRLVSRWPARGGPVVVDDIVYFAAGVWPSEGVYVYALAVSSGKVLWCNADSGSIFMGQPHGGASAVSGVAAQGYLVATEDTLLVPTGRAVPAAFDRATGKFRYFHLQANGSKGGASTLAIGRWFFNAGFTFDVATGQALDPVGAGEVAVIPDGLIVSGKKDLVAYRWVDKSKSDKAKLTTLRYKGLDKVWTMPEVPGATAIVVAGNSVICGGDRQVTVVDSAARKVVWSAQVDGAAYGLAVSGGRLYVSTDQGSIYCYENTTAEPVIQRRVTKGEVDAAADASAAEIARYGVLDGYAVDLACGDGALAHAMALRTNLNIVGLDNDPDNVTRARRRLDAAGLYGTRVTIHQGRPEDARYPRYFADLVFSSRTMSATSPAGVEAARLQRPYGGLALFGAPGAYQKSERGALEGAGNWTHQYADAANSCCSSDALVQGPLNMLWYRDSDFDGPSRHGRGPAPLFLDGRLFVEGLHGIRAVNAYNGRRLWEYPLPNILKAYDGEHLVGTAATQSNFCAAGSAVYVRTGSRCLRLDAATGKKLAELEAPRRADGQSAPWGYLACEDGLLFGSLADPRHVVKYAYGKADMSQLLTESTSLFVLDAATGQHRWTYTARHSIRHNALAVAAGRVYLIDRPLAAKDVAGADKNLEHPSGELVVLDAASGKVLWRSAQDVYGTTLAVSAAHDVLLMAYQPTRFKLASEIGGRLAAFKASTGARLWDRPASYGTRPLINGRTIYAQGGAWDLLSGEPSLFALKRSYGCGQLAGCVNLMVFRSATLGYYDLASPKGVVDYGGLRPGCWINAIPAGGVVLAPDATSGCRCSYLNQAWVVLQPAENR